MSDRRTILVTGVSGFVGAGVARRFAAAGWHVRGLVRASSARTNLHDFPGDLVEGDMRDEAAVGRALAGADGLAHVAADYRLWARDPEDIVRANRDGTRATMAAALAAGTRRVVYTSSVAAIPPVAGGVADETRPLDPAAVVGAYKRSKAIAERIVVDMVAAGLPAVIVNPSTPIGPRDVRPTPTGRVLVDAANGRTPAYVDTGLNLAHVDDVAEGHRLAFERGAIGRRYILGGEDVPLRDLLAEVARATGRRPPRVRLPVAPLVPLAYASEAVARVTGREPRLTLDTLRMAGHHMYYSSARAHAELGYAARPWREAVADALAWFRGAGMIA